MGGADQWGNITAGLELIRRTSWCRGGADGRRDRAGHGLAYQLLLSPSGTKFGKSEGGESVWLDPARTSPVRVLPVLAQHRRSRRRHVPALVHRVPARADRGARGRDRGRIPRRAPPSARWRTTSRPGPTGPRPPSGRSPIRRPRSRPGRSTIRRSSRRCTRPPAGSSSIRAWLAAGTAVLLAEAGLFTSRGEARRMIAGGGVTVNGERVNGPGRPSRSRSPGSGSMSGSASAAARSDAPEGRRVGAVPGRTAHDVSVDDERGAPR